MYEYLIILRMQRLLLFTIIILSNNLFSQTPTVQPTNFKEEASYAWKINFSMSIPTNVTGSLIFISTQPMTLKPSDAKEYLPGEWLGNAKVIKAMKATGYVKLDYFSLVANTKYYITSYSFNGSGTSIKYNPTNPLVGQITTKGKEIGTYYKSLTSDMPDFLSKLTALINNHNFETYSNFIRVVNEFYEKDTVVSNQTQKYLNCDYSNKKVVYSPPFAFANMTLNYNREHVLCKNWMNFRGIPNGDLVQYPEGADYHNLLLTDGGVNSERSDDPLDKVATNSVAWGDAKKGKNSNGKYVFEPKDDMKGNAARCQFYQILCYNGVLGKNWGYNGLNSYGVNENQDVLKAWATTDTPDNYEIARHELIYSYQKSRNPFIDFPDWINCVNFKDVTQLKTCAGLSASLSVLYPTWDVIYSFVENDKLNIKFNLLSPDNVSFNIVDLQGRVLYSDVKHCNSGENSLVIDLKENSASIYFIQLNAKDLTYKSKIRM